jgi:hypothetical protein
MGMPPESVTFFQRLGRDHLDRGGGGLRQVGECRKAKKSGDGENVWRIARISEPNTACNV